MMMRTRKPTRKSDGSLCLNFEGRVKKSSRKNIQIVTHYYSFHLGIQILSGREDKGGYAARETH